MPNRVMGRGSRTNLPLSKPPWWRLERYGMRSTRELILLLRAANPAADVTEDHIRSAIRRELVEPPSTFAGRYAWSWDEAKAVAEALGLLTDDLREKLSRPGDALGEESQ